MQVGGLDEGAHRLFDELATMHQEPGAPAARGGAGQDVGRRDGFAGPGTHLNEEPPTALLEPRAGALVHIVLVVTERQHVSGCHARAIHRASGSGIFAMCAEAALRALLLLLCCVAPS
mgnify:CR=1 FL=1